MSQLEDYIKTLSKEEQEEFSDLIEECRNREQKLDELSASTKKLVIELESNWNILFESISTLKSISSSTLSDVSNIQNKLEFMNYLANDDVVIH